MQKIESLLKQSKWTDDELSDILNSYADAIKSLEPMGAYYKIVVDSLRKDQHIYDRIASSRGHTLSKDKRIIVFDKYIKLQDCVDRQLYRLNARNITIGVFNQAENEFIGIRFKFGCSRIESEYHWDNQAPYATAKPIEVIGELPKDICVFGNNDSSKLFNWLEEQKKKLNV